VGVAVAHPTIRLVIQPYVNGDADAPDGRPPLNPKTRERIQEALRAPGWPGVRKIAEQFGVNASTVQHISSGL
jgi:hypothetical protein